MRALCILHDAYSTTGLIGAALRNRGWEVDEITVVPAERYATPDVEYEFPDHTKYDLIVPMGAPWAVYDDEGIGSWLAPELVWLAQTVEDGGAVFGICFGAQALARALGGAVALGPRPEMGWMTIPTTEAGEGLIMPGPWFQWHFDAFTPPPGATVLASTDAAVQAFRIGRSLAVQFHPEVTTEDVVLWLENGADEARGLGLDPAELLAETARRESAAAARAEALVDAYLGGIFAVRSPLGSAPDVLPN